MIGYQVKVYQGQKGQKKKIFSQRFNKVGFISWLKLWFKFI